MEEIKYQKARKLIEQADNILLVCHYNPDPDALGSMCAMSLYLKNIGKPYIMYCHDEPPAQFGFIPAVSDVHYKVSANGAEHNFLLDFNAHDLIILFDCGSLARSGIKDEILARNPGQLVIEFDHHLKTDDFSDLEIRDPSASSTSELVYGFFKANRIKVTKDMAQAVLTGIVADTGNFLYPNATQEVILLASELLLYGTSIPKIADKTFRNKTIEGMKLWGFVMENLMINKEHSLAISVLSNEGVKRMSIDQEEMEGIANYLGNLGGVKGTLFLREQEKGRIKGSLRSSRPDVDISKLARMLGGGGHKKSAGFMVEGKLVREGERWRIV